MSARGAAAAPAVAILALAAAVRVGVVVVTPDYSPRADAADYDRHGVSIATGDGYPPTQLAGGGGPTAFRAPVYPVLLGWVYGATATADTPARWQVARLVQALMGAGTVALLGLLAFLVWGRNVALVAAGLAAVYPPLVAWSGAALVSEAPFLLLELAAILALVVARRSRGDLLPWMAACGALAGLAVLARPVGPFLLAVLAIGAWHLPPRRSPRSLARPAVVLAAAAAIVLPWLVRNVVVMDAFVPVTTATGFALAGTYNDVARTDPVHPGAWRPNVPEAMRVARDPDLDEVEVERRLRAMAWEEIREHPRYPLRVAGWNLLRMLEVEGRDYARAVYRDVGLGARFADAGFYAFLALAPLAVAGLFTRGARRAPWFVWAAPAVSVAVAAFVSGTTSRFRAPAEPFLVLAASLAIVRLAESRAARGRPT